MSRRVKQLSLDLERRKRTPGKKLGRPRGPNPRIRHRPREAIPAHCPVHVTLKLRRGLPSLRKHRFVRAFRTSLAQACARHRFRVVHYSIQRDHLHLLIEAQGKEALACGMKSIGARVGRAVNRVFGHEGPVLADRYHHRLVTSPRDARRSLAYVLLNARRHWAKEHGSAPPVRLDVASSGIWFDGWTRLTHGPPEWPCDVAPPTTWLLRAGWRKHGLIDPSEVPGVALPKRVRATGSVR